MNITQVLPAELQPAVYNPRNIDSTQLEELARSLIEYGFVEPVIMNESSGFLVGGHQRVKAVPIAVAKITEELKGVPIASSREQLLRDRLIELSTVPVLKLHLSENQEKALNIALNKISGDWDNHKLAALLASITDESLPTGFSQDEINELLTQYELDSGSDPLTDPDEIPEIDPASIITQRGDLWILGNHRLVCGDSTSQADIDKLLEGSKAGMVFTDPPYLMNYQGAMGKGGVKNQRHSVITNDNLGKQEGDEFLRKVCRSVKNNCTGGWYISFYRLGIDRLYIAMASEGLHWRNLVIWAKEHFTLSNSDYKSQYEPIIMGWSDDYTPIFYGWNDLHDFQGKKGEKDIWEIELPSVWQIARTKKNDLHPTIKPVELCERAICNSSRLGGTVLDLFGGSGSTLIAAEKSGRRSRLMELEPHYCDVIIKRWENYTGKKAEKAG